jgi:hypothetical protein
MDSNANPCGELGEYCVRLSEVQETAAELTCVNFTTWHLLPAPHCKVCIPKMDVLVVYCPSPILLDAILYAQQHSIAERSNTSLKLLLETSCHRLCFDKQFHCRNSVLH